MMEVWIESETGSGSEKCGDGGVPLRHSRGTKAKEGGASDHDIRGAAEGVA